MDLSNIYLVYRVHPHENGIHHRLVAKFILDNDTFEVLEDHTGLFEGMHTPAAISAMVDSLQRSMYYVLASLQDLNDGQHPELLKEHVAPEAAGPESSFKYHRVGMPQPQVLEFHSGKPYVDGHPVADQDLQLILNNVQAGHATLTYNDQASDDEIQKAEAEFAVLAKAAAPLDQALSQLRQAVRQGHVPENILRTLTSEIYKDSMVRRMGNKRAYTDFLARPKQGVHIRMDGNDFGGINKLHGYETGNAAIVAMGGAIREAMDEAVGSKNGKLYRIGGDEFHGFVPDLDSAALFARHVRNKLEKIPPVGGTHNLALSIGFGHTPDHAEYAMINAKGAKKAANHKPGTSTTYAASQVPGFEGVIPTGPDQLRLRALPKDPMEIVQQVPHILPPDVDQSAVPKPPKK